MSCHLFQLKKYLVIVRPGDNRLFILNPTAAWVWQAAAAGCSPAETCSLLADHFKISSKDARRDLEVLYDQWNTLGLSPCLSETSRKTKLTPVVSPFVLKCSAKLPGNDSPSLQNSFHFGRERIALIDYTPDLSTYFAPLLSSLHRVEEIEPKNTITVFKDAAEYVIVCNNVELERTSLELIAVGRVIQAMIECGYPQTTWMACIHASAGSLCGRGVIFPGIGGSGKSTLMAALAGSGWTYWSDDTVPLDVQGRAGAVPLNPCLKSGSWEVLTPFHPLLPDLPVYKRYGKDVRYLPLVNEKAAFNTTLPVHGVVFPVYAPERTQELHSLSAVEGLQCLIEAQSWISPDPERIHEMIHWIQTIPIYKLEYHSIDWAVHCLGQLVYDGCL